MIMVRKSKLSQAPEVKPAYMSDDDWAILTALRAKQREADEQYRRTVRREMVPAIICLLSGLIFLGAMSYGVSALAKWIDLPMSVRVPFAVAGVAYVIYWFTKPRPSEKD